MTQRGSDSFDLVVKGGRVYDPANGLDMVADVGIRRGHIAAIGRDLAIRPAKLDYPPHMGTQVVDAEGKFVCPGFIDLHTHVFTGVCPLTVPADPIASSSGITTMVSAGDAGAYSITGFRRLTVESSHTRVLAFLHISVVGLITWPHGEMVDINYADVDLAIEAIEQHRDIIVGIKVRETAPDVVGENGLEPLRRAIAVGEATSLPVMCHIGNTPTVLTEVLDLLRPGDILTHCFTGSANNLVVERALVDGAHRARDRGVIFDIGHGFGSFDFSVAEIAISEGLFPDTISTDIHSLSAAGPAKNLQTTMSKLLHLGMPLEDVVEAVTSRSAQVIGRQSEIGAIEVGREADLAVFELVDSPLIVHDAYGHTRTLERWINIRETIRRGVPWGGPFPHPGPMI